jgi:hypothetical protein
MPKTIRRNTTHKRKKTNQRRTSRKMHKKRNSRKYRMRGGNFGGNCPDPNFSIYNTNMLKLFPY